MKQLLLLLSLFVSVTAFAQKRPDTSSRNPAKFTFHDLFAKSDQPLYILNGEVMSLNKLRRIDTNLVERISIIKAPDAITLYGKAARFGAVLMDTKPVMKNIKL